MDIGRLAIVVIVSYILGLGTGLVGGVVFSFREFSAPASETLVAASPAPSASPTETSAAASTGASSASPSPGRTPSATSTVASRPHSEASDDAGDALPLATPDDAAPQTSQSRTPLASAALDATPASRPAASPSPPARAPERATLAITANKGPGFAVFVDGKRTGETPLTVTVAPDVAHLIKVAGGDTYQSWQIRVKPTAGEKRAVQAVLSYVPPPAAAPPPPRYAPAPRYYPPAPAPRYIPPASGGGRPGVYGNTRW